MKETKNEAISNALLNLIFGLILCIFNVSILTSMARFIGILCIILSILFLFTYFQKRMTTTFTTLLLGLVLLAIGIYMTMRPTQFISILPMLIGIVLIINSLSHFQKVLILKDHGFDQWKINLAGVVFILLIGIILLMKPIQSLDFIFQLAGSFMIVNAIMIFLDYHFLEKMHSNK